MRTLKQFVWITPLALLIGCAAPVQSDHTIAEWQANGMLPPTGDSTSRVYSQRDTYPATEPSIIVQTDNGKTAAGDLALADSIRRQFEYDRGLAPSLKQVTVEVQNGRVILRGSVRSDIDQRAIVDSVRDMAGVTRITDDLEIDPNL
jgi:osmotically-inducible protein OsmY